jgi:oligopeptide transport system substrate-binding protein
MSYSEKRLIGNLADRCVYQTDQRLTCHIKSSAKWQDGSKVKPDQFRNAFVQMLTASNQSRQADLLFPIKNAKSFYLGQSKESDLGIKVKKQEIQFELEKPDREFIYTLASPLLSALPPTGIPDVEDVQKNPGAYLSAGPYQIVSWDPLKKIILKNNPLYWKKINRPQLEIVFVSEDSVAISLYESDKLDLLRRLPTAYIPKYKGTPEFFEIDQFRFDYLGFAPKWQDNINLRQAISQAIDYIELQKLYVAKSPPGCPGILKDLYNGNVCINFDLEKSKSAFAEVKEKPKNFALMYSKQGGDDHKRSMEWIQGQIKKNLDYSIQATAMEDKIYTEKLKNDPPDFFRRGVAPPRPTCLAALETFRSKGPDNFIGFENPKYDLLMDKLLVSRSANEKKKLCSEALHLLIDDFRLIPTGPLYFTLLGKTKFVGWKLNELNQLDLSELRLR